MNENKNVDWPTVAAWLIILGFVVLFWTGVVWAVKAVF